MGFVNYHLIQSLNFPFLRPTSRWTQVTLQPLSWLYKEEERYGPVQLQFAPQTDNKNFIFY